MNIIPQNIMLEIVRLLNQRGFVLDIDVESFCKDDLFNGCISSNIKELIANGYEGGELECWSTAFQGPSTAYGVYDTSKEVNNDYLIEYCHLRDMNLDDSRLTIVKLNAFNLGIKFNCHACSHESVVSPDVLKKFSFDKYLEIRGKCTNCPEKSIHPSGTYPYNKNA